MLSWVTTQHLMKWTSAKGIGEVPLHFSQISTDSRTIQPGEIFLALKGEHFDGHQHIQLAKDRGAVGSIAERSTVEKFPALIVNDSLVAFIQIAKQLRENFLGPVFAITGSAGKSSTKEMLATLLGKKTLSSPASFNNLIGLSKTLCLMEDSTEKIVYEMGMNAKGEIAELCEAFRPLGGCITNIGDAHIGRLGGAEGIYQAKKELFDYLAREGCSLGLALNQDDNSVMRAFHASFSLSQVQEVRKVLYGKGSICDLELLSTESNPQNGHLKIGWRYRFDKNEIELPIFGLHQAQNLIAAISGALLFDCSIQEICERLALIRPAKHRGEIRKTKKGGILIDESYNANPTAMRSALQSLTGFSSSIPRLLVLGEMRELDAFAEKAHTQMGQFLLSLLQKLGSKDVYVIGVGELTRHLLSPLEEAGVGCCHFLEVGKAMDKVKQLLLPHQLVFVKGSRGIALDQIIEAISQ